MENLNITIVQSNLHWENTDANLEMFSKKIASINEPTDLIVLPEMFNTGFTMNTKAVAENMNGKTKQWMKQRCKEKNCAITGSLIVVENGRYYNRLIFMWPDGSYEIYNKRHLFRMADEDNYFTPGRERIIVELKGWNICPLVCYDLRFPVWSRNTWARESKFKKSNKDLIAEYDALIYVANWPERRSYPWKSLLVARAIENQSYVVGVNRTGNDGNNINHSGDSIVLNFKGEPISQTKSNEEFIATVSLNYAELEEFRKTFPVGLDADEFSVNE